MQRPHLIPYYLAKEGNDVTFLYLESLTSMLNRKENIKPVNNDYYGSIIKVKKIGMLPYARKFRAVKFLNRIWFSLTNKINYDVVIITHPSQLMYLRPPVDRNYSVIYECMDNYSAWMKNNSELINFNNQEKELIGIADSVVVSSDELKLKIKESYNPGSIEVIYNACDHENLAALNSGEVLLKHPNLMYIGTMSNWLDMGTLEKFALENPDYTVYLIGPRDTNFNYNKSKDLNNIIFIGTIEFKDVPAYIKSGDIMLLPFIVNNITKYVDPVKVYEYLYFNKRIISSYWSELDKFKPYIEFYNNYETFCDSVFKLINSGNPTDNNNKLNVAGWADRANQYSNLIDNLFILNKSK
jgi:hypothetical protein